MKGLGFQFFYPPGPITNKFHENITRRSTVEMYSKIDETTVTGPYEPPILSYNPHDDVSNLSSLGAFTNIRIEHDFITGFIKSFAENPIVILSIEALNINYIMEESAIVIRHGLNITEGALNVTITNGAEIKTFPLILPGFMLEAKYSVKTVDRTPSDYDDVWYVILGSANTLKFDRTYSISDEITMTCPFTDVTTTEWYIVETDTVSYASSFRNAVFGKYDIFITAKDGSANGSVFSVARHPNGVSIGSGISLLTESSLPIVDSSRGVTNFLDSWTVPKFQTDVRDIPILAGMSNFYVIKDIINSNLIDSGGIPHSVEIIVSEDGTSVNIRTTPPVAEAGLTVASASADTFSTDTRIILVGY